MVKTFLGLEHQNRFRLMRAELPELQRFDLSTVSLIYVLSGCPELNALISTAFHTEHGLDSERALLICQKAENDDIRKLGLVTVCMYANRSVSVQDLSHIKNDQHFELLIEAIQIKRRGLDDAAYSPAQDGYSTFNEN